MIAYTDPIEAAVRHVFEVKKANPEWPLTFIVSKVSNWHQLDFHSILEYIKAKTKSAKKGRRNDANALVKPDNIERDREGYPLDTPYWVKE